MDEPTILPIEEPWAKPMRWTDRHGVHYVRFYGAKKRETCEERFASYKEDVRIAREQEARWQRTYAWIIPRGQGE